MNGANGILEHTERLYEDEEAHDDNILIMPDGGESSKLVVNENTGVCCVYFKEFVGTRMDLIRLWIDFLEA